MLTGFARRMLKFKKRNSKAHTWALVSSSTVINANDWCDAIGANANIDYVIDIHSDLSRMELLRTFMGNIVS